MSSFDQDMSHLDSKYFIDSQVYNCPYCNRRNVVYSVATHVSFDWSVDKKCHVYIIFCTSCNRESLHLSFEDIHQVRAISSDRTFYRFKDEIEDIDSHIFHSIPTSHFTIDTRVPRIIRELVTEAEGCLKMNYLTGASACMRKAIYELLVIEDSEGESYEERIKSLKREFDTVNPELFDILSHIQQMTSDKIHEQAWDKWDSPNLKLIIETLKSILYEIYVLPEERSESFKVIQRLREKVTQR